MRVLLVLAAFLFAGVVSAHNCRHDRSFGYDPYFNPYLNATPFYNPYFPTSPYTYQPAVRSFYFYSPSPDGRYLIPYRFQYDY